MSDKLSLVVLGTIHQMIPYATSHHPQKHASVRPHAKSAQWLSSASPATCNYRIAGCLVLLS